MFETRGGGWTTADLDKMFKIAPHLQVYELANMACKNATKLKVYDSSWLLIVWI